MRRSFYPRFTDEEIYNKVIVPQLGHVGPLCQLIVWFLSQQRLFKSISIGYLERH